MRDAVAADYPGRLRGFLRDRNAYFHPIARCADDANVHRVNRSPRLAAPLTRRLDAQSCEAETFAMTTFEIRFSHSFGPEELRERAESFARSAEERYKTTWRWEGDNLHISTPSSSAYAVSAIMAVEPTEVRLSVAMPLSLLPVRVTLEQDLRWAIERIFGLSLRPKAP